MSVDIAANRKHGVRVLGLAFGALFVLLCIAALIAYPGWHARPAYWAEEQRRLSSIPVAQRKAVSQSLHNRLLTQWSDPGEKTPKTQADLFGHRREIEIGYDELNTWIATEGIALLADVGITLPRSVRGAMIDSPGDALLRFTLDIDQSDIQQVVALSFAITIANDGTVTSTLQQATAGRVPLPTQSAIELLAQRSGEGIMLDLMLGNPVAPIELPIDPSKNGARDGRLVGLEVLDNALVITRETVRRNKQNPPDG